MKLKNILSAIALIVFVTGCSTTNKNINQQMTADYNNRQKIMKSFNEWKGTKYKYGGTTKKGIDCSAFIGKVYKKQFGLNLPRTTTYLKKEGVKIKKSNLKIGDMVFFRNNKHVGIYVGKGEFIHSSTSKGVIKSNLNTGYYAKNYTQARRIID